MEKLKKIFKKRSNKANKNTEPAEPIPPQPYNHIPLGLGGIINAPTQPGAAEDTAQLATNHYIGTTSTTNTLGVFFQVSDTQCFAAHIDAYTLHPTSSAPAMKHYTANFRSAEQIRTTVLARLRTTVKSSPTQHMRETLVMTCSRLSGVETRCAYVVAQAVREWMGDGMGEGGRIAGDGVGFFAGWPGKGSVVLKGEVEEGWVAKDVGGALEEWKIVITEMEVEGSEEGW